MWFVVLVLVVAGLGFTFVRMAKWSREASEDLKSFGPSEDEKYGIWGIFRRRP